MLPAQLQALYGNDPAYQTYLNWVAGGAQHPYWDPAAEAAATAAGIQRYTGIEDAYADDPSRVRVASYDWGEQKKFNLATGAEVSKSRDWIKWVQDWTQQHFGGAPTTTSTLAPPSLTQTIAGATAPPAAGPSLTSIFSQSVANTPPAAAPVRPVTGDGWMYGRGLAPKQPDRWLAAPGTRRVAVTRRLAG